jgi:hypothetical protein
MLNTRLNYRDGEANYCTKHTGTYSKISKQNTSSVRLGCKGVELTLGYKLTENDKRCKWLGRKTDNWLVNICTKKLHIVYDWLIEQ